jgi:hypothetical protein
MLVIKTQTVLLAKAASILFNHEVKRIERIERLGRTKYHEHREPINN